MLHYHLLLRSFWKQKHMLSIQPGRSVLAMKNLFCRWTILERFVYLFLERNKSISCIFCAFIYGIIVCLSGLQTYGFITVCNGRELNWICSELRHSQEYHFRVRYLAKVCCQDDISICRRQFFNQSYCRFCFSRLFLSFKLRAVNADGESGWSEPVTYKTKPSKPNPPEKPYPKGRIHATSVKLAWGKLVQYICTSKISISTVSVA